MKRETSNVITDSSVYPAGDWRLLQTGLADGATNMAIDEAILWAVAEGESRPTLRFYGWQPPCLSIGYNQSMEDEVDVGRCREAGIGLVRRATGGRAILHADELTYSVVAPQAEPRVAGGVIESYRRLSVGLVAGLRALGLDACQALTPTPPAPLPLSQRTWERGRGGLHRSSLPAPPCPPSVPLNPGGEAGEGNPVPPSPRVGREERGKQHRLWPPAPSRSSSLHPNSGGEAGEASPVPPSPRVGREERGKQHRLWPPAPSRSSSLHPNSGGEAGEASPVPPSLRVGRGGVGGRGEQSAACFDAPSSYEITVGGRKLVGSAQVRKKGVVLQHGSLPLEGDIARIFDFLKVPSEERREELKLELRARATSLELAVGYSVPFEEVARHLAAGFAQALNLRLIPGQLSQHELALAEKLRREKYAARGWNLRR